MSMWSRSLLLYSYKLYADQMAGFKPAPYDIQLNQDGLAKLIEKKGVCGYILLIFFGSWDVKNAKPIITELIYRSLQCCTMVKKAQ